MLPLAEKLHAHELIEQMAPSQLNAAIGLLEDLLDPLARKLAAAPVDDEPTTEEDREAIVRSQSAVLVSSDDLLASFGLTSEDFHRLAAPPLDVNP